MQARLVLLQAASKYQEGSTGALNGLCKYKWSLQVRTKIITVFSVTSITLLHLPEIREDHSISFRFARKSSACPDMHNDLDFTISQKRCIYLRNVRKEIRL